jgi:hypothetical protein
LVQCRPPKGKILRCRTFFCRHHRSRRFQESRHLRQSHQYPNGTRTAAIVNRDIAVSNAAHTGALPGRRLRRNTVGNVG